MMRFISSPCVHSVWTVNIRYSLPDDVVHIVPPVSTLCEQSILGHYYLMIRFISSSCVHSVWTVNIRSLLPDDEVHIVPPCPLCVNSQYQVFITWWWGSYRPPLSTLCEQSILGHYYLIMRFTSSPRVHSVWTVNIRSLLPDDEVHIVLPCPFCVNSQY
jgi:hydrogenase maturation factor